MYTKIETKDWETFYALVSRYEEFKEGIQRALAFFGVAANDAPVEPPSFPNIPFRPEGVPQVIFRFTTSRKEENAEFPDDEAVQRVISELHYFIKIFLAGTGIKYELWPEFSLANWCEGIG